MDCQSKTPVDCSRGGQSHLDATLSRTVGGKCVRLRTQQGRPKSPQLLDWLAKEFMDSGWSMKHIHRLIVANHTYWISLSPTPDLAITDTNSDDNCADRGPNDLLAQPFSETDRQNRFLRLARPLFHAQRDLLPKSTDARQASRFVTLDRPRSVSKHRYCLDRQVYPTYGGCFFNVSDRSLQC